MLQFMRYNNSMQANNTQQNNSKQKRLHVARSVL